MSTADRDPILEACAQACHAAYRAERAGGKLHVPEECPCKDSHLRPLSAWGPWKCLRCGANLHLGGLDEACPACRPALRAWPDLTEADRETFRAQARPAVEVLSARQARLVAVAEAAQAYQDDPGDTKYEVLTERLAMLEEDT